jgi:hypothetical protein
MGAFKPTFVGIPDDFFPLTNWEIFKYTLFVVVVIFGVMGVMIGFLFWIVNAGLSGYTTAWSIATLCFTIIMIILFYVGGRKRIQ